MRKILFVAVAGLAAFTASPAAAEDRVYGFCTMRNNQGNSLAVTPVLLLEMTALNNGYPSYAEKFHDWEEKFSPPAHPIFRMGSYKMGGFRDQFGEKAAELGEDHPDCFFGSTIERVQAWRELNKAMKLEESLLRDWRPEDVKVYEVRDWNWRVVEPN